MSDNEIYLLIKYTKSLLWRVAKCLSYIEEARCLKVKPWNFGRNFLTAWLYGNLIALAYLISAAHSSLSTAFWCHLLTFIFRRSFSTYSTHHQGLPLLLLPSGSLSNIFLTFLTWSILTTFPTHPNLFLLISATMSRFLFSSLNSWSVFNSPHSLLYTRSIYFPLPCTQPFHIHLSHCPCFTPEHCSWIHRRFVYLNLS